MPYDRQGTSMARFLLCARCRDEYDDPASRRFHAQSIACPACGPRLALWDAGGKCLDEGHAALVAAAAAIREGGIVAVEGLGGFHLVVDARSEDAVARLRTCKRRPDKPLAVMFPTLGAIEGLCDLGPTERHLLAGAGAPIVIARRSPSLSLAPSVAHGQARLGVMLPYTPLHHLLMGELGFPVVATSGNPPGEPMVVDEREAVERLAGMADLFLVHDRPIVRAVDDSLVQVVLGREQVLRAGRGYAPTWSAWAPCRRGAGDGRGAEGRRGRDAGRRVVVGQHLGDVSSPGASPHWSSGGSSLSVLHGVMPSAIAHDLHPDYASTGWPAFAAAPRRGASPSGPCGRLPRRARPRRPGAWASPGTAPAMDRRHRYGRRVPRRR